MARSKSKETFRNVKFDYPYNLEAERFVLGAMLSNKSAVNDCITHLEPASFYDGHNLTDNPHRNIFIAIDELNTRGDPIDIVSVTNELIRRNLLDECGGTDYLFELTESVISLVNLKENVNIVENLTFLRKYLIALEDIAIEYSHSPIDNISEFLNGSMAKLKDITDKSVTQGFRSAESLAKEVKQKILNQKQNDGLTGVTTGFTQLNNLTLGFKESEMIVLGARPSVGKTTLAINIALKTALATKRTVGVFSLEMDADQLIKKMIGIQSRLNLSQLQLGDIKDTKQIAKLNEAINTLSQTKLFIEDSPNSSLTSILTKARQLKHEHPDLALIVIDYLGLIKMPETMSAESRQQEVSYISRTLKQLARELETPILILSQVSRKCEEEGRAPQPSDLRESGAIEQDADIIMFLHRESEDKIASRLNKKLNSLNDDERSRANQQLQIKNLVNTLGTNVQMITLNVAKNRNGSVGSFMLHFFKNYGAFDEPSQQFLDELERIKSSSNSSGYNN